MSFLHPFGLLYLKLAGWKLEKGADLQLDRCVVIAAPHSSNWDFPHTVATGAALNLPFKVLLKHTVFRPPYGWFFKAIGALPIDRRSSGNYVEKVANMFTTRDRIALVVAPEGTRTKANTWKSGFYHIAKAADVPIALGFLDFSTKTCGIRKMIYPIGTEAEVMDEIREFYRPLMAHSPENFTEPRLRCELEDQTAAAAE